MSLSFPEHLAQSLKTTDPDRYFAYLRAPLAMQRALHGLTLFDVELRAIAQRTCNPLLHEIQLQFWRDLFAQNSSSSSQTKNGAPSPPLQSSGVPVADLMRDIASLYTLPTNRIISLIDARTIDTQPISFESSSHLLQHLKEGPAAFFELAIRISLQENTKNQSGLSPEEVDRLAQTFSIPAGIVSGSLEILQSSFTAQDTSSKTRYILVLAQDHYHELVTSLKTLPSPLATRLRHALAPLRLARPYLKRFSHAPIKPYKAPELYLRMWWLMRYHL